MTTYLLSGLLFVVALWSVSLRKSYSFLPVAELKYQAKTGNAVAQVFWRAVAYGFSLQAWLWTITGAAAVGSLVLLSLVVPLGLVFLAGLIVVWLVFAWLPQTAVTEPEIRLTLWTTTVLVPLLRYTHIPLNAIASRYSASVSHTGLFDTNDLLELLDRQADQLDSRIPVSDLELTKHALRFEAQKVRSLLTPRKKVKTVPRDDPIGPILLDELHVSGQACFPVYNGQSDNFIGTLFLDDVSIKSTGKVSDYMEAHVTYVHESDNASDVLRAALRTKARMFVVVNSFEEYVGIISLEKLLQKLLGEPIDEAEEFDAHQNLQAVAARHPSRKKPAKPSISKDEPVKKAEKAEKPEESLPENTEEVLE